VTSCGQGAPVAERAQTQLEVSAQLHATHTQGSLIVVSSQLMWAVHLDKLCERGSEQLCRYYTHNRQLPGYYKEYGDRGGRTRVHTSLEPRALTDELRGWAFEITLGVPLDQNTSLDSHQLCFLQYKQYGDEGRRASERAYFRSALQRATRFGLLLS
jgi:hypothetical protein